MYLIINGNKKNIVDTVSELKNNNLSGCKVYSLVEVDPSELVSDGDVRDSIYELLKGEQYSKEYVVETVKEKLGIKASEVSKVITKMKREKVIYDVIDMPWIGIN